MRKLFPTQQSPIFCTQNQSVKRKNKLISNTHRGKAVLSCLLSEYINYMYKQSINLHLSTDFTQKAK